jgi:hypothetical protein
MEENGAENEKNVSITWTDPNTGKFVKGNPGGGRPLKSENYRTIYRKALKHLAQLNDTTPEALEVEMHANALKKARAGDFAFYRDVLDRVYGRAVQPTDITTGGQPFFTVPKEVAEKNNITITDPESLPQPEEDDTNTEAV